jgi:hypothetical protein
VSFTKVSATSLKLTLPLHAAGDVVIRVVTPAGTSATGSDATFTYRAPEAPQISELAPSSGSTLVVNTVMVNGSDLIGATKVTAGGTGVKFVKVSDTQLKITVPKLTDGGDLDVVVTTPSGTSGAGVWTAVAPPAPQIDSLSVDSGLTSAVTPVTVTGTELGGITKVTLGGANVAFKKVSATSLTFTAPKHAAGDVAVIAIGRGGPSEPVTFTYVPPPVPTVSALAADSGYTDRTTTITVTGSDLTGASKVTSAGKSVTFTKLSDSQLTVIMPKAGAGTVEVVVTTPGGSSDPATFTYALPPAPDVSVITPAFGAAGRTTVVTVSGAGFTGATKLTLGGKAVTFKVVSDTVLKLTMPARPTGTHDLVVVGPGGTNGTEPEARFSYA